MKKWMYFGTVIFSILVLTGCGGKKELQPGIDAYEQGDYEAAYNFFAEANKKEPTKASKKWMDKAKKPYVESLIEQINSEYSKKNFEKALELVEFSLEIDPAHKDIKTSLKTVESSYKAQKSFDKYTSYLNEQKTELSTIIDSWQTLYFQYQNNQLTIPQLVAASKPLLEGSSKSKKTVEEKGYSLKDEELVELNNQLYEYASSVNRSLLEISLLKARNDGTQASVTDMVEPLDADKRQSVFLALKSGIDQYVNQEDVEGKKTRNLKNTLSF